MKRFIGVVIAAILGGAVAIGGYKIIEEPEQEAKVEQTRHEGFKTVPAQKTNYTDSAPRNPQPPQQVKVVPDFKKAAEETVHAVVHIRSESKQKSSVYDYFFRDFFDDHPGFRGPESRPVIGIGSGVIVSDDGYIVTNNHVVAQAERVEVTLNDKRSFEAKIVGTDPSTDLALLKIDAKNLDYISYGNSDEVQVGEWVLAVGNPFNLQSTVTAGIVSAKARNINILRNPQGGSTIESFIQTDAAVNKGNSGGALVNAKGELVGINAAIASNTGSYAGYSFAIPVNIVKKVVNDFINYGAIQRAYIGVVIREMNSRLAEEEGLEKIQGVYVEDLSDNGAAKEAGIKPGDLIVSIEGQPINSTARLLELVGQHRPGDEVTVTVVRDGKEKTYDVTLRNRLGTTKIVEESEENLMGMLNARFEPVSDKLKEKLGINNGVQVIDLNKGKLSEAGVREGFIIVRIDKQKVNSIDDIKKALKNKSGGVLLEGVYPNGMRAYYGFGL
ncbi:MAG: Do family serine endopeptidase [Bacteroidales bacterium]|nr:Do family serine endopeptidase [Bacteroidales bacterium]